MIQKYIKYFVPACLFFLWFGAQTAIADDSLPFSNLYVFGDSLSDIGNISGAPYTNRNIDRSASLWANDLASDFGWDISASNAGGTDFAQAGAVTGALGFDPHSTAETVQSQINQFISASKGHIDKNALYTVWVGGNDLKDYFMYGMFSISSAQLIANSTNNIAAIVNELHQAGAKYILVPNIPDFSNSPLINQNPLYKRFKPQIFKLVQGYNTQLLATLNSTGINIIQVDTAGMLNVVQANYAKFGFMGPLSEVSCNPLTSLVCQNPEGGIFNYDGLHPSQATHQIAADYILSVLEAPEYDAFLGEAPLTVMNTQNKQIQSELTTVQSGLVNVAPNHWHVFSSGSYNTAHKDSSNIMSPGYHQDSTAFTVGADYRLDDHWLLGVAVGRSMGKLNDSNSSSNYGFNLDENLVNLFGGYQFWNNQATIDGSLGFGYINESNIHRSFMLGDYSDIVSGNTTGSHYDAALMTGYNFEFLNNKLKTGPIASLEFQRVVINPYAEKSGNFESNNVAFDALQYKRQNFDSFVGGLGWQINYTVTIDDIDVMPYLQATYNHEMMHNNTVEAGVTSLPGSYFTLPVGLPYQDYGLFSGGVQGAFKNGVVVSVGYNALAAHRYTSQNVMLNLSIPF